MVQTHPIVATSIWIVVVSASISSAIASDVPAIAIEARLTAGAETVEIDLFGKTPEEFRALLREWAGTDKLPAQEVDLALELTNKGAKPILVQLWNGDGPRLSWVLKGPGALDVLAVREMPAGHVEPINREIPAGKSATFPVKALLHGRRGVERRTYLTEAGEYRVTAKLETHAAYFDPRQDVKPAFKPIVVETMPVTLKVVEKK